MTKTILLKGQYFKTQLLLTDTKEIHKRNLSKINSRNKKVNKLTVKSAS